MTNSFRISVSIYLLTTTLLASHIAVEAIETVTRAGIIKFVVAIKSPGRVCTGTILHKDYVMTAAHCFYHDGKEVNPDDVAVMAGITNYEYPQQDTGQMRKAKKIKKHPSFWYNRLAKYDIALLKVNESFVFNDYVQNIAIAEDSWPVHREVENNCMSIGFGTYIGNKSPVKALKVWNVTAGYGRDNCPCSRRFQWKRLVCAKNADYAKLCAGDDGGPLVCDNVVRGIAHMVRNWYKCKDEEPSYPLDNCIGSPQRGLSIYIYLCPFNDWLHSYVNIIPKSPQTCGVALASSSATLVVFLFIFGLVNGKMLNCFVCK